MKLEDSTTYQATIYQGLQQGRISQPDDLLLTLGKVRFGAGDPQRTNSMRDIRQHLALLRVNSCAELLEVQ